MKRDELMPNQSWHPCETAELVLGRMQQKTKSEINDVFGQIRKREHLKASMGASKSRAKMSFVVTTQILLAHREFPCGDPLLIKATPACNGASSSDVRVWHNSVLQRVSRPS
jgi:hypothetical protein